MNSNQPSGAMAKLAQLSTTTKLLAGGGLLLFIDLFLDWQQACGRIGGGQICGGSTGWGGIGVLVGLLVVALLAWEAAQLAGKTESLNVPATLVTVGLAGAILLFTIIKFFVDDAARHWPAYIGLILAIAIGVGGWQRLQSGTPRPLS